MHMYALSLDKRSIKTTYKIFLKNNNSTIYNMFVFGFVITFLDLLTICFVYSTVD